VDSIRPTDAEIEDLRQSEERLRLAIAETGIGIWDVDSRTGARRWSPEFKKIIGVPADAVPSVDLFSALIHPEDRDWVNELYRRAYSSPEAGAYDAEFRIVRQNDGAVRWVVTTGRIYFDGDRLPVRGIGTLRDVHERRMITEELRISEERHRLAIEANRLGTWDYDMVARVHRWSQEFRAMWGLPAEGPNDPAIIRPLVEPEDNRRVIAAWNAAMASDGRIDLEYPHRRMGSDEVRWAGFQGQIFFDAQRKPVRAIGVMIDITDRKLAEERQRLLLGELNHRVKNIFATIQAIVAQTLRTAPEPALASERIQARLLALSSTHDLLNTTSWSGAPLRSLIEAELRPYGLGDGRIDLAGPAVDLDAETTLAVGMVAHELATNAAKYGSLSQSEGRLSVRWSVDGTGRLRIDWAERGGPPVTAPSRSGFGSKLIERSLADLDGTAEFDFAATGLRVRLAFPIPRKRSA